MSNELDIRLGAKIMRNAVALTLALTFLAFTSVGYTEHVIDSSKNPQYLFVMSAKSGSFDGKTVTLNDVPAVIYFSDRPNRIAGHMSLKEFFEIWSKGADSFKADPPNATLSILGEKGNENAVVEISNPKIEGDAISFRVRLLKGNIPNSFGASSVFIDPEYLHPGVYVS